MELKKPIDGNKYMNIKTGEFKKERPENREASALPAEYLAGIEARVSQKASQRKTERERPAEIKIFLRHAASSLDYPPDGIRHAAKFIVDALNLFTPGEESVPPNLSTTIDVRKKGKIQTRLKNFDPSRNRDYTIQELKKLLTELTSSSGGKRKTRKRKCKYKKRKTRKSGKTKKRTQKHRKKKKRQTHRR